MRAILIGATGQMGRVISEIANEKGVEIVAGIASKRQDFDYPVYDNFNIDEDADIIIDFSTRDLLENVLELAIKKNTPLVIATTGYDQTDFERIEKASEKIPIIYERNYSLGINLMKEIVGVIAKSLKDFDIEIIEKHHRYKADSPSGTAELLFESVNTARDKMLKRVDGRSGFEKSGRDNLEVGISSVRGGTVVGEHGVNFYGEDEVIEITHKAYSKKLFANGALISAKFLQGKAPGLYTLKDVLE